MKLLMDIGNQRVKWATTDDGATLGAGGEMDWAEGDANTKVKARRASPPRSPSPQSQPPASLAARLAAQIAHLDRPSAVWGACVARAQIKQAVAHFTRKAWSLRPVWISAAQQPAGLVNCYQSPATLGSDRWSALVAVSEMFPQQAVIVVDVGTAVTVDLLARGGVFRGGVIFPGIQSMQQALAAHTENIQAEHLAIAQAESTTVNACINPAATDTRAAIANGTLLAVAGGVNLAIAQQRALAQTECRVIATGGDAERLAPWLAGEVQIKPQLVLWGLAVLSREAAW